MGLLRRSVPKKIEDIYLAAYDKHAAKILRHLYIRTNDKPLAEDLVSETFTKIWDYLREGKEIRNFKSFLYRVSNNLLVDYYKVKNKLPVSLDAMPEIADTKESYIRKIELETDFSFVKKYFHYLSFDYRKILIYRFVDNLSIKEISQLTGKSIANVYTSIHRGLRILRQKLEENENQYRPIF